MEPASQPANRPSVEPQEQKTLRKKLIRLNDLIPKKNVSGGRVAIFGAVPSGSGKTKTK